MHVASLSLLPLNTAIQEFLEDLAAVHRALPTRWAYAADLSQLAAWHAGGSLQAITPESLRRFLAQYSHLSPATHARKEAALASFFRWAYRREWLAANPMDRVERVKLDPPTPRGIDREQAEAILATIPAQRQRDRLLFRLLLETGLRIGEALHLYVEDLSLRVDDEHLTVRGKGGRSRTLLLDDPRLVRQLRAYLKQTGYRHGPLFRAEKNGRGGPLRYQSVQQLWARYCTQADIRCTLHQLRHTHASELLNGGVSLATIRKRLGHKHIQTTLRYAELADETADAEVRAWRRQHD
jgi:integrase/recombinase XerD